MNMEETSQQQATDEPRRHPNKLARVAFGPELETPIPARDRPEALATSHRSFTTVEQKQQTLAPPARPTSSSAGESAAVGGSESPPRRASPRRAESGRPAQLKRVKSDYGPNRVTFDKPATGDEDEDIAMRHGWQEEYTSSEYLKILHSVSLPDSLVLSFSTLT